ncbi:MULTISPECIES: LysR family transcriptional regulator [Paenibacillus]|uniref:LysR family transcriptional regulator n=1 Tax=Paenibacillus TaxID=44249 RepID=UPI001F2379E9|nr:LysR family transcriptional regulator [Paenibacillus sp. EPM92]
MLLDRLEGRFFRTFIAVLEERSISKAAARLGYVQSTVTTQVRLLEESVGQRLFDRLPRGVEPTEAGRKLEAYAYRFLQLGAELEEGLAEHGEPRGVVRLQVLESFGASYLWDALQSFFIKYPHIDVQIAAGFQADTLEALRDRRIDLGLIPGLGEEEWTDMEFEPVARDELIWVASPERAERIRAKGWGGAADARLVGFGSRCMYTSEAESLLSGEAARAMGRAEFASLDMIKQAVRSGWGIAFVPRSGVSRELAAGTLSACAPLGKKEITHGLVHLKQRTPRRPVNLLRAHIAGCGLNRLMIE